MCAAEIEINRRLAPEIYLGVAPVRSQGIEAVRATLAQEGGLDPGDLNLWFCLTCDTCSRRCPAGVNFRDFMEGLRELLVAGGDPAGAHSCPTCGTPFDGTPRLDHVQRRLEASERAGLELCPRCRKRAAADRLRAMQSPLPKGTHARISGGGP